MAYKKSPQEMTSILKGGKILGEILYTISQDVKPGVTAWDIDQKAERLIREAGGVPAFKGYTTHRSEPPFPSTICASKNEEVVHGIATKDKVLHDGDIFSIDIGMVYEGLITDTALTVAVGIISEDAQRLIDVTYESVKRGIIAAQPGGTIADIGKSIENYVNGAGKYGIVRDLVGHGVGHQLHEDPRIPNYYDEELEQWGLKSGVVIAIEPMITLGSYQVETAVDGWSISTKDKSLSAHFEHTVVITDDGPQVATARPNESF